MLLFEWLHFVISPMPRLKSCNHIIDASPGTSEQTAQTLEL